MSKSLFEIEKNLSSIFQELEENGGELTPELKESLALSKEELKEKSINYVHYIQKLENDLVLASAYEIKVKEFKARKQKAIDRLKESLLDAVTAFGDIEADIFTIKTRKSESVEIIDEAALPMYCFESKVVRTVSKTKIKDLIKSEGSVPGAELKTNFNLSIK
jgi:hypothetical protein